MDTDSSRRLNRSSPSRLNRPTERTDFFHGLLGANEQFSRVGAKVIVRSIGNAGHTMRALTVTSKLRLQGSALAAGLARIDVQSTLTDVSWRTAARHVTGASVVCRG